MQKKNIFYKKTSASFFLSVTSLFILYLLYIFIDIYILFFTSRIHFIYHFLLFFIAVCGIIILFISGTMDSIVDRIKNLPIEKRRNIIIILFFIYLTVIVFFKIYLDLLSTRQTLILMISILVLWYIEFILNKDTPKDIEKDAQQEKVEEKMREMEYAEKYPLINRVWGMRWIMKWMYKEGWYGGGLIIALLLFFIIQSLQIGTIGVGTDEGNSINTLKLMISNNLVLYKDFWAREPGSLFILWPVVKIFGYSLSTLRYSIIFIQIIIIFLTYIIVRDNFNKNFGILSVFLLLLFNNVFIRLYPGSFHQIWHLLFLGLLVVIYSLFECKENRFYLIILGLITGYSILSYKYSCIFLLIIPTIIWVIQEGTLRSKFKNIQYFLWSSFIPIALFIIYYSAKTDFMHIYNIIIGDVLIIYLFLSIVSVIFLILLYFLNVGNSDIPNQMERGIFNYRVSAKHYQKPIILVKRLFKKIIDTFFFNSIFESHNFMVFLSIISLLCVLVWGMLDYIRGDGSIFSTWWLMFVEASYVFLAVFTLNIQNVKSNKKVFWIYYIMVATLIYFSYTLGFGETGLFRMMPNKFQLTILLILISYLTIVPFLCFNKNNLFKKIEMKFYYIFLIIINFFLLFLIFGGYFFVGRYITFACIFPFLLPLLLFNLKRNIFKYALIFLVLISLIFSSYIHGSIPNDYTFYSPKSVQKVVYFIESNSSEKDTIFTGDLVLASEIKRENIIHISSPWIYRGTPSYLYNGINKYKTQVSMNKAQIADLLLTKKPKFIVGSGRATWMTFFDEGNDPSNIKFKKILNSEYQCITTIDQFTIYILKDS